MADEKKREVVRTALLAVWGMATLVLFFCVVLLVVQMIRQGQDPIAIGRIPDTVAVKENPGNATPARSQEVRLYFARANGLGIAPESRLVEFTASTVENCRLALSALIAGPESAALLAAVPPETAIRGIYLVEAGELVVDFSRELEAGLVKSAAAELAMVQSVVGTLTQPRLRGEQDAAVRRVRFLFEGDPPQDSFPSHLDLLDPIEFNDAWIDRTGEGPGDA